MSGDHATRSSVPPPLAGALIGAFAAGVVGGVVGLVVGFRVHAATAGFAALELGLPAAFVGLWTGLIVGGVVSLVRDGMRGQVDQSSRALRRTDTGVAVAVAVGATAVLSAVRWMDWAHRSDAIGTTAFRNGPAPLLVAATLVSVILALVVALTHWRWLRVVLITATLLTAGTAITVALSRISEANTTQAVGAATTSFQPGAVVAVLAAFAIVAAATFGLLASYTLQSSLGARTADS
jgi:hypothetical protein